MAMNRMRFRVGRFRVATWGLMRLIQPLNGLFFETEPEISYF
jgi:hypothetical protein